MPLKKDSSKAMFKQNVKEMYQSGHPLKQALAAEYSQQPGRAATSDRATTCGT